ncbi:MAG TPA: hypothetical protein VFF51_05015 [Candidatus Methylomirabilis sp.]|nr:hypothetical protein [Candidatus Methylomirabilis sp.]
MARTCGCGETLRSVMDEWGCLHCGGTCCPCCGYAPEGTAYCPECAQSLFGVYTRQAVVVRPKRISAWWEAAAFQPIRSRTESANIERPR